MILALYLAGWGAAAGFGMLGPLWAYAFALCLPAVFVLDTWALWVLYLGVMNLDRVYDAGQFPPGAERVARLTLFVGYIQDFVYNIVWASVLFLDPPRELLVTSRLRRYKYGDRNLPSVSGWRLALTYWFVDNALDPYEHDGQHVDPY